MKGRKKQREQFGATPIEALPKFDEDDVSDTSVDCRVVRLSFYEHVTS